jgi:hypothetical protein
MSHFNSCNSYNEDGTPCQCNCTVRLNEDLICYCCQHPFADHELVPDGELMEEYYEEEINTGVNISNIDYEEIISLRNEYKFNWIDICSILKISQSKLFRWRMANNFNEVDYKTMARLSDDELDHLLIPFVQENPTHGEILTWGYLDSIGVYCTRDDLRDSLNRIDRELRASRRSKCCIRRVYNVQGPCSLYHVDGNHKLRVMYGIVVHGIIDGFTRAIVGLRYSNNNSAKTVFDVFIEGIKVWGRPDRMRADFGGENILIERDMISAYNGDETRFLKGKSVHNQRIERLWRDVTRAVSIKYKNYFEQMERDGAIDIHDLISKFVLQFLFLPRMNHDLMQFVNAWNHHRLSTEGNKSPLQLWKLHESKIPEDAIDNIYDYGKYDENDDVASDDEDDDYTNNQVEVPNYNPFNDDDLFEVFKNNIEPFSSDDKLDESLYEYFDQVVVYCKELLNN